MRRIFGVDFSERNILQEDPTLKFLNIANVLLLKFKLSFKFKR